MGHALQKLSVSDVGVKPVLGKKREESAFGYIIEKVEEYEDLYINSVISTDALTEQLEKLQGLLRSEGYACAALAQQYQNGIHAQPDRVLQSSFAIATFEAIKRAMLDEDVQRTRARF